MGISEAQIRDFCLDYLGRTLARVIPSHEIVAEARFASLGLDSASSTHLLVELEDWLGIELSPEIVFEYPTIKDLARFLARQSPPVDGCH
jgi:acyl carrier protein